MVFIRWFAATPFGVDGITAGELRALGFSDVRADNGRVYFEADMAGALRANLWLRTAERVYLLAGEFDAATFDELFEGIVALPWEDMLPPDASVPVRAQCARSRLMSPSDCQKIMKKAIAERFRRQLGLPRLPETGPTCAVSLWLFHDKAVLGVDASGNAMHKRGYRLLNHEAPLRETLAAALLLSGPWRKNAPLHDPMCGSGAIVIEAAMIAAQIAPGLGRAFDMEKWPSLSPEAAAAEREQAANARRPLPAPISGGDIDPEAIRLSREHAKLAGLSDALEFRVEDASSFTPNLPRGVFCVNPPYGERLGGDQEARAAIETLRALHGRSPGWQTQFITTYAGAQKVWGRKPSSQRRFYNGRLECVSYVYTDFR